MKQNLIVTGLTGLSLLLLAAIFVSPLWWVSLTAPNYPPEAFPDGVRIHFHMTGVFNGCRKVEKDEIQEVEALDCVHEMDTINHYVGMYPIAAGGPIERAFSQFLMPFLGVMLLGFVITSAGLRSAVMGVGFAVILILMYLTIYADNGFSGAEAFAGSLRYQGRCTSCARWSRSVEQATPHRSTACHFREGSAAQW